MGLEPLIGRRSAWKLRSHRHSPRYTTSWNELLRASFAVVRSRLRDGASQRSLCQTPEANDVHHMPIVGYSDI
jgi:hypothetical protein